MKKQLSNVKKQQNNPKNSKNEQNLNGDAKENSEKNAIPTLNENEQKVTAVKKFGFNSIDSVFAIILGGVCAPFICAILGSIILSMIGGGNMDAINALLEIPFVYILFSCTTLIGYGVYVIIVCKRKKKQNAMIRDSGNKEQIKEKTKLILRGKCSWKNVIICVSIALIALSLVSMFINVCTYSLQAIGYQKSNEIPLSLDNVWNLILALIFMCALPAIAEEFLFRGVILTGLLNGVKSHFARIICVVLSAIIFALCHQSAQQFMFPLIMGLVFGFIYFFTSNIWYSVITHFASNAIVIIVNFITQTFNINAAVSISPLYCVIALLFLFVFFGIMYYLFKKIRKDNKNKSVLDIDNIDVSEDKIENALIEDKKELLQINTDGVVTLKKTRAENIKNSKWVLIVALAVLIILQIIDLTTYL